MDNGRFLRVQVWFLFFGIVSLIGNFLLFYIFQDREKRYRETFKLDESLVLGVVRDSVGDFLANFTSNLVDDTNQPFADSPRVVYLDGLYFFESLHGRPLCGVGRNVYSVGDWWEFGNIVDIVSDRVYCSLSNSVYIVRSSPDYEFPRYSAAEEAKSPTESAASSPQPNNGASFSY